MCFCLSTMIIFPTDCRLIPVMAYYKTEGELRFRIQTIFCITCLNWNCYFVCVLVVNQIQLWLLNRRFGLWFTIDAQVFIFICTSVLLLGLLCSLIYLILDICECCLFPGLRSLFSSAIHWCNEPMMRLTYGRSYNVLEGCYSMFMYVIKFKKIRQHTEEAIDELM